MRSSRKCKILFFQKYIVIGKSCKLQTWTETIGEKSKFKVKIPVDSFNSGISARDDDVMEILKAKHYPNILFETNWLSEDEIKKYCLINYGVSFKNTYLGIVCRKYQKRRQTQKLLFWLQLKLTMIVHNFHHY